MTARTDRPVGEAMEDASVLTTREVEVVKLICQRMSYPEIAVVLGVGHATVKTHVKNLFRKSGVNRRAELIRWYQEGSHVLVRRDLEIQRTKAEFIRRLRELQSGVEPPTANALYRALMSGAATDGCVDGVTDYMLRYLSGTYGADGMRAFYLMLQSWGILRRERTHWYVLVRDSLAEARRAALEHRLVEPSRLLGAQRLAESVGLSMLLANFDDIEAEFGQGDIVVPGKA